ncbi:MAG: UDP-N-acetylmuramoyl-tripeptide--D-alanyl-D-alanine ligase [Nitrospirae bacterium]|nr:UDP-N-acetylmuramoyl-tripeptide--D-alanyl-D-alanine ligase [Nitrospirota bacterium]
MFSIDDVLNSDPTASVVVCNGAGRFDAVSVDSRTIQKGELFLALMGQNSDGGDFLNDAMKKTHGAIISLSHARRLNPADYPSSTIIASEDTLTTLQRLAAHLRAKANLKVIAITGTNGKTTTKEMTATVLQRRFRVLKTTGNLNNHIGLPLTLTRLDGHDVAVLEMGASRIGDIRQLCEIARPDIGIITNIGPGHLEGFGSLEGVRSGKLELMDAVGHLIVNADDHFLMAEVLEKNRTMHKRLTTCAVDAGAEFSARIINANGTGLRLEVTLPDASVREIDIPVGGAFNVYNALAALAAGYVVVNHDNELDKPAIDRFFDEAIDALSEFKGVAMRFEIRQHRGATVLYDVYNANPASMKAAVADLVRFRGRRAIAVVGDMLELGSYSEGLHALLGRWMSQLPVDVLITVGESMKIAADEFVNQRKSKSGVHSVGDCNSAREILDKILLVGDTVLIKGSRGNKMETILQ